MTDDSSPDSSREEKRSLAFLLVSYTPLAHSSFETKEPATLAPVRARAWRSHIRPSEQALTRDKACNMVCALHSLLAAAAVLKQASRWTPPMRKRRPALAPRYALKVEQDARWPGWTESVDPAAKLLYMPFLET